MNPVVEYRKTYDKTGAFTGVELVQGDNVVKITLNIHGALFHGGRWIEVREIIDGFQKQATKEVMEAAAIPTELTKTKRFEPATKA